MIRLNVPYLPDSQIAAKADSLLTKAGLDSLPVEIEFLIESHYGIHIVPSDELLRFFGIDGYSTSDFSAIYVDGFVYRQRPYRYRFTIAHELGHRVLHEQYIRRVTFSSPDEWVNVECELDKADYARMEYQANVFAGRILVPQSHLEVEFRRELSAIRPQIKQALDGGLRRADYVQYALSTIADELSSRFEVSAEALRIRMESDSLDELIE